MNANSPQTPPPQQRPKPVPPVGWLLGPQMWNFVKGNLLYAAYGSKIDPRKWMRARVYPTDEQIRNGETWNATGDEFWFDYLSDTGDGQQATYSVAYLCLSDLYVQTRDPQQLNIGDAVEKDPRAGYEQLPRGEFLFVGGDTAYHVSDYITLANLFQLPFNWAFADLVKAGRLKRDAPRRPLIGIPGNHDYYDLLDGFHRQFRRPTCDEPPQGPPVTNKTGCPQLAINGFRRVQEASYVALRLPFDWWLWGLDTDVGQIDDLQRNFFRGLCQPDPQKADGSNSIIPPDKLILATTAPTTVLGRIADADFGKVAAAMGQIGLSQPFLPDDKESRDAAHDLSTTGDAKLERGQCRLDISGDTHHYARYWGPQNRQAGDAPLRPEAKRTRVAPEARSYASVVSGVGGAFLHPTTTFIDEIQEQALYPSESVSRGVVAERIFKFWKIWGGGSVWLGGFICAFILYFACAVPPSSRQFLNNLPPLQRLGLTISEPITPTTNVATREPVSSFWNNFGFNIPAWTPPPPCALNQPRYFFGPCAVARPLDLKLGLLLLFASFIPIIAASVFRKKLFNVEGEPDTLRSDAKASEIVNEDGETKIKASDLDSEAFAKPDKWLWLIVALTATLGFLGFATMKPYNAHSAPFVSSLLVLFSIVWGIAAAVLGIRYREFLFKKARRHSIRPVDWLLPRVLSVLSVASIGYGLWSFGMNNLPALLVSDIAFVCALAFLILFNLRLPFSDGAELLMPHGKLVRLVGRFLLGFFHMLLQIAVPFLLIRRGTPLTWALAFALVFLPIVLGQTLMKRNTRWGLTIAWIVYGALMLALPFLTSSFAPTMAPTFLSVDWQGWRGLIPSVIAGITGAIFACVWFGWYLAVCLAFNGHNNEAAGASRIEEFKQFVRIRLTEKTLTAYVIAVDEVSIEGDKLKPRIIDVFQLETK